MSIHTITKFFNQFIRTIKQETKNIGIITDKDGTILLDDSLKRALQNFREKELGVNVYLIANSGRTVQDMINSLKEENIPIEYFDYIIGDNGGMCIDVKRKEQVYKHVMDTEIVLKVIREFIRLGGSIEDIRLADGKNIFAYPSENVLNYYGNKKDIIYRKDFLDLEGIDITKLTLAAEHDKIEKINRYIRENIKGYKTHMGKTSFPTKDRDNYRIDFTRNAYKRTSL